MKLRKFSREGRVGITEQLFFFSLFIMVNYLAKNTPFPSPGFLDCTTGLESLVCIGPIPKIICMVTGFSNFY